MSNKFTFNNTSVARNDNQMMYKATEEHRNALKEFDKVKKELDLLYKSNRMHKPSQSIHLANKLGYLKENFQHFKKK